MFDIKQVIIIRKDLNMRKGKMCAQAAHASNYAVLDGNKNMSIFEQWIISGTTKIVVSCDSLQHLEMLEHWAKQLNIPTYKVTDFGLTEFNGEQTVTCIALGPYYSETIDIVTKDLKLL